MGLGVRDGTQATVWVWRFGREEERDDWAIENGFAGGGWQGVQMMTIQKTWNVTPARALKGTSAARTNNRLEGVSTRRAQK